MLGGQLDGSLILSLVNGFHHWLHDILLSGLHGASLPLSSTAVPTLRMPYCSVDRWVYRLLFRSLTAFMTVSALYCLLECSSDNSLKCWSECSSDCLWEWIHYVDWVQVIKPRKGHRRNIPITLENGVLSVLWLPRMSPGKAYCPVCRLDFLSDCWHLFTDGFPGGSLAGRLVGLLVG